MTDDTKFHMVVPASQEALLLAIQSAQERASVLGIVVSVIDHEGDEMCRVLPIYVGPPHCADDQQ